MVLKYIIHWSLKNEREAPHHLLCPTHLFQHTNKRISFMRSQALRKASCSSGYTTVCQTCSPHQIQLSWHLSPPFSCLDIWGMLSAVIRSPHLSLTQVFLSTKPKGFCPVQDNIMLLHVQLINFSPFHTCKYPHKTVLTPKTLPQRTPKPEWYFRLNWRPLTVLWVFSLKVLCTPY